VQLMKDLENNACEEGDFYIKKTTFITFKL
jgi:hypothetical protein